MPGVPGEPPGIVDRSREHLVASDLPGVTARRLLIKMATDLQSGIEPYAAQHAEVYRVRAIDGLTTIGDFDEFLKEYGEKGLADAAAFGSRAGAGGRASR
jgi:hypothetical protein